MTSTLLRILMIVIAGAGDRAAAFQSAVASAPREDRQAATTRSTTDAPLHVVSLVNPDAEQQTAREYSRWLDRELEHLVGGLDDLGLEPDTLLVELCNPPGGQYLSGGRRGDMRMFHEHAWRAEYVRAWAAITARLRGRAEIWGYDLLGEPQAAGCADGRERWRATAIQVGALVNNWAPGAHVVVEPLQGSWAELQLDGFFPLPNVNHQVCGFVPGDRIVAAVAAARQSATDPLRSVDFGQLYSVLARAKAACGLPMLLAGRRSLVENGDWQSGQILRQRLLFEKGIASPMEVLVGRPLNHERSIVVGPVEQAPILAAADLDDVRPEWMPLMRLPRRVLPSPVDPSQSSPQGEEDIMAPDAPVTVDAGTPPADGGPADASAGAGWDAPSGPEHQPLRDLADGVAVAAQRFGFDAVSHVQGLVFSPSTVLVRWAAEDPETYRYSVRGMVGDGSYLPFDESGTTELLAVRIPVHAAIERLRPFVAHVEPDMKLTLCQSGGAQVLQPNDVLYSRQYSLHTAGGEVLASDLTWFTTTPNADINAPQGWFRSTGSTDVEVAVIDTGVYDHVDFYAVDNTNTLLPLEQRPPNPSVSNIWSNPGEIAGNGLDDDLNGLVDDVRGWDFIGGDNNPFESERHGTRVAGIIGAMGGNGGTGLAQGRGVSGVAWRCKIVPLRVFNEGSMTSIASIGVAALEYCRQKQFEVVNCSWAATSVSAGTDLQTLRDKIVSMQSSTSNPRGQLVVAAAGNSNANLDAAGVAKTYPACFDLTNIVSVAASDCLDAHWIDSSVSGSNWSPTSIDLYAPGKNIWGLAPGISGVGQYYGKYTSSGSGTSYAAPHVSGAAVLLWSQNPAWTYLQVRQRILSTVRLAPAFTGRVATGGILDLGAALGTSGSAMPQVAIVDPPSSTTRVAGTPVQFVMTVGGATVGLPDIYWTSDSSGGVLSSGALSFATSTLPVGTHNVVAWARGDSGFGLTGSATRVVTIVGAPTPTAPTSAAVAAVAGGWRVSWVDNSSGDAAETSFELQRQKKVGNSWTQTTPLWSNADTESLVDSPGSGLWRYRIRARNSSQPSSWSGWAYTN